MRLKESTGWFAAGPRMLAALRLLSDGAFKLFVYLALTADRGSGCLALRQADLARALGKSRNSIGAYLEELARQHICVIKPAPNQHQPGAIQITDDFWPYHRDPVSESAAGEAAFVEQIRSWLAHYAIVRSSFGAVERKLAAQWFRDGIPWRQVERALLLGLSRKHLAAYNSTAPSPIYSLNYFLPLLDEVAHVDVSDQYWEYLRRRLIDLDAAWRDQYSTGKGAPPAVPASRLSSEASATKSARRD